MILETVVLRNSNLDYNKKQIIFSKYALVYTGTTNNMKKNLSVSLLSNIKISMEDTTLFHYTQVSVSIIENEKNS